MTQPQQYLGADRRRHQISHEELRRQLIAADEERYGLHCEVGGRWTARRRRMTIGVGAAFVGAMTTAAYWEKCPPFARSDTRSAFCLQTSGLPAPLVSMSTVPALVPAALEQSASGPQADSHFALQRHAKTRMSGVRRQTVSKSRSPRPRRPLLVRALMRVTPQSWLAGLRHKITKAASPGDVGKKAL
jgi:hypothetical protein